MLPHSQHLPTLPSRREFLSQAANGFGAVALASLLPGWCDAASNPKQAARALAPKATHFPAAAKSVIFLYMDGGPSSVDTFNERPLLEKVHGKSPHEVFQKVEATQFNNIGSMLKSPWKFTKHGQCGLPVSALFPHVGTCADELCVIHSMTSKFSEHTFANYFLHTGSGLQGRPSHGAWITYGLGSECENLPGFVILNGGLIPPGGLDCFGSGFLPAAYQGSVFRPTDEPVANIRAREKTQALQEGKLSLMKQLDQHALQRTGPADALESALQNYELAAKMQAAVPDLMDLSQETAATQAAYGLTDDFKQTQTFGRICLVARRLVERGVRFIELTCPGGSGDRWDQHGNLFDGHTKNSRAVDQPIAALINDLKERGLLSSTLLVWCGEFGRTPFAQGTDGRDHNPFGFTIWMAGGGVKGGMSYGATDEFGYRAVENKLEMHDLHATMLHLLGVDHTRQTYRFGGRDMRLTDVFGHVVKDVLA